MEQLQKQMFVIDTQGNARGGATAVRYLSRKLPLLWPLALSDGGQIVLAEFRGEDAMAGFEVLQEAVGNLLPVGDFPEQATRLVRQSLLIGSRSLPMQVVVVFQL